MSLFKKLSKGVLALGPGIFAIGYTIGTGSVTSMLVAGSTYGMQLLWVLLLSSFFSGVLMYVFGNYTLLTGETVLLAFKRRLQFGNALALMIIFGILIGQWNSLIGILGITSNIIYEVIELYFPSINNYRYWIVLFIALAIIVTFYVFLLRGSYLFFEKILVLFVAIMGLSFLIGMLLLFPDPQDIIDGLIPSIPKIEGGKMMVAAFVGTTMAAATFLSRPLFIKGKGWTSNDMELQKRDSMVAALMIFVISGAIMAVSCGARHYSGGVIEKVSDMPASLEPIAGKFAVLIFFAATLCAGLSSIFPILLIVPLLLADYQSGKLDTTSKQFRVLTAIASIIGLTIPIFGSNPIQGQILSQVFNVFVLPLVIIGIILLINLPHFKIKNKPSNWLQFGLIGALIFAILISYNGITSIISFFSN